MQHGRHIAIVFSDELMHHVQRILNQSWVEQINNTFRNFFTLVRNTTQQCSIVLAQPNQMYSHLAELATVQSKFFILHNF